VHVGKLRLRTRRLARQASLVIGRRLMGIVAARLPAKIALRISTATALRRFVILPVLATETLVRRPRLDQRAVDAEVIAARQSLPVRQHLHPLEKYSSQSLVEQPVPILAERRM